MGEYAAAWGRGDPEAAFAFYGDDIMMHLPGRGSLAGTHRGRQAVIATIKGLLARTDGLPVEVEVLDRLVSEERVALVLREAATRGEELLELRRVNLYRVTDGKIRDRDLRGKPVRGRRVLRLRPATALSRRRRAAAQATISCPDPAGAAGVAERVEHAVGSRQTACPLILSRPSSVPRLAVPRGRSCHTGSPLLSTGPFERLLGRGLPGAPARL